METSASGVRFYTARQCHLPFSLANFGNWSGMKSFVEYLFVPDENVNADAKLRFFNIRIIGVSTNVENIPASYTET